jgi:BlaI family transcriptional regulator, penicillinase repressor
VQLLHNAEEIRHSGGCISLFIYRSGESITYVVNKTETIMAERISDAEHAVMEILWEDAPLEATAVAAALEGRQDWTLATVKTLLSRLLAKGALAADTQGRKFLYRPIIAREDYVTGESRRLVDRLFGGKLSPLVAQMAAQEALTADDIAEIEALLKELKK